MADAGAGIALSIVRWGPLYDVKPLTIRFDAPIFINRLPFEETNYVQFRWVIGINKAF
jgi:aminopeptidase N